MFTGSTNLVSAGQVVRVTGFARERFDQTTLNGSNSNTAAVPAANIVACGTGSVAADRRHPALRSLDYPERYEGMLVRFPQPLVIAEYFNYDRFGEIVLALPLDGEPRPFSGTAIDEPGAAANARAARERLQPDHARRRPERAEPAGPAASRTARRSRSTNRFRGGDLVANAVGVLGFDFSLYRIYPTGRRRLHGREPAAGGAGAGGRHAPRGGDEHAQLLPHARLPDRQRAGPGTCGANAEPGVPRRRCRPADGVHPPARQAARGA